MLIYAFAAELFELIKFDRIRDRLENGLYDWLASTPSI
jgi:hypothetical protein